MFADERSFITYEFHIISSDISESKYCNKLTIERL